MHDGVVKEVLQLQHGPRLFEWDDWCQCSSCNGKFPVCVLQKAVPQPVCPVDGGCVLTPADGVHLHVRLPASLRGGSPTTEGNGDSVLRMWEATWVAMLPFRALAACVERLGCIGACGIPSVACARTGCVNGRADNPSAVAACL